MELWSSHEIVIFMRVCACAIVRSKMTGKSVERKKNTQRDQERKHSNRKEKEGERCPLKFLISKGNNLKSIYDNLNENQLGKATLSLRTVRPKWNDLSSRIYDKICINVPFTLWLVGDQVFCIQLWLTTIKPAIPTSLISTVLLFYRLAAFGDSMSKTFHLSLLFWSFKHV